MNYAHHLLKLIYFLTDKTKKGQQVWVDNVGCFETYLEGSDLYLIVDEDANEVLLIINDIPSFNLRREKILLCDAHTLFWLHITELVNAVTLSLKG